MRHLQEESYGRDRCHRVLRGTRRGSPWGGPLPRGAPAAPCHLRSGLRGRVSLSHRARWRADLPHGGGQPAGAELRRTRPRADLCRRRSRLVHPSGAVRPRDLAAHAADPLGRASHRHRPQRHGRHLRSGQPQPGGRGRSGRARDLGPRPADRWRAGRAARCRAPQRSGGRAGWMGPSRAPDPRHGGRPHFRDADAGLDDPARRIRVAGSGLSRDTLRGSCHSGAVGGPARARPLRRPRHRPPARRHAAREAAASEPARGHDSLGHGRRRPGPGALPHRLRRAGP